MNLTTKDIMFLGNLTIRFGIHNDQLKVYVRDSKTKKEKNKSLSFFWKNNSYQIQTDLSYFEKGTFRTTIETTGRNRKKTSSIEIPTAKEDNKRLEELKRQLEYIIANNLKENATPDDVFKTYALALNVEAKKEVTLLEFAITFRELWKNNQVNIKYSQESGNYVIYDKLIHKLQGKYKGKNADWANEVKYFANLPISNITNKDYENWAKFIIKYKLGFRDSVNAFRAAAYYYNRVILKNHNYKLNSVKEYTPNKPKDTGVKTLTNKQLKQLKDFNVNLICPQMTPEKKRSMIDALLLTYGLVSRPIDILSMRIEDIQRTPNNQKQLEWNYCPQKLINRATATPTLINNDTLNIILKYKGNRTSGYLLPFSCNLEEGTLQTRKVPTNRVATKIGKFFQEIAKYHNWDIKPIMYTMRHTAITDLIKKGVPITQIAAIAHTSTKQILNTYADRINLSRSADMNCLNI